MRKLLGLSGLVLWLSMTGAAQAKLTIYYLRHAEAGHNVVAKFVASGIPTNQWPAYVGHGDIFTPDGEAQVRGVTTNLLAYKFDFIAVSPTWRTRQTILPFLKATGRTAEIWPELTEVGLEATNSEPVIPEVVIGHEPLKVPQDEQTSFKFRLDSAGCCEMWATNVAQVTWQAKQVLDLLRTRFGKRDATVLLVGHGTAGRTLIRYLTRQPSWNEDWLHNAALWMAVEKPGGTFELKLLNGAPYPAAPPH
ncbi:MAG: histidine phosphatase family protein [Verrucomicrobiota bacterium]